MTKPQELMAGLIRKARFRLRELARCDFEWIHVPIRVNLGQITKAMLEHLLQENKALQFALDNYSSKISSSFIPTSSISPSDSSMDPGRHKPLGAAPTGPHPPLLPEDYPLLPRDRTPQAALAPSSSSSSSRRD
ncbi:hypothetical protein HGM15179_021435 [Zosterops borbonicus]|uniref:Uncharacterized protein n=1 Tax=Zosterops borbonicus TaxID=364589 RepID=A0A8K1D5W7_9PASS|nr:hypothetical protein HGM15179_021435 [Zosterops borbonicus]